MTIQIANNNPRISYTATGGQTAFPTSFAFFVDGDINVYINDVLKTLTTDYAVTGGSGLAGTVTLVTGATAGDIVVLTRDVELERTTDFPTSGPFQVASLNVELDKLVAMIADMEDFAGRGLRLSDSDTSAALVLANKDARKGTVLAFNTVTGAVEVGPTIADTQSIADIKADIAALADIEDGTVATDAISGLAAIASDVTTAASNITEIQGASANAATATAKAAEADSSAVAASASATASAASAVTSGASATTSTTQAGVATAQAVIATTKANEAAASEVSAEAAKDAAVVAQGNAETAETNAETAETNAETAEATATTQAGIATTKAGEASTDAATATAQATIATTKAGEASTDAATATTQAGIATTKAGEASTDAATATTKAAEAVVSASNASASAVTAAASQVAAANSAAAAANTFDNFDDTYLGTKASDPTVDNDGDALVAGALYFNSTDNEMRVYDGGGWIAASSAGGASLLEYNYTATAGQTTFSGADDNAATLAYVAANLIVTLNGIVLENGTDYTATNGTSIVLTVAAAVDDELNVVAFKSFTTADMVPASTGGTFNGNVNVNGAVTADGLTVNSGAIDSATTIQSSDSNVRIKLIDGDASNGVFLVGKGENLAFETNGNNERIRIESNGNLQHLSKPAYFARAWVNFKGTGTVSIRDSGNVSSVTDLGTGDYRVNFSTAMTDADYSIHFGGSPQNGRFLVNWAGTINNGSTAVVNSTSNCRIAMIDGGSGSRQDAANAYVSIFR